MLGGQGGGWGAQELTKIYYRVGLFLRVSKREHQKFYSNYIKRLNLFPRVSKKILESTKELRRKAKQ